MVDEPNDNEQEENTADMDQEEVKERSMSYFDRVLAREGELSPRHKRLAAMLAQGKSEKQIVLELGFSQGRVNALKNHPRIKEEIERITERVYQDTVSVWLKDMIEPAQAEIARCLTDRSNRYKESTKIQVAQWLIEMNHGKAKQTIDAGENVLSAMYDRLDAMTKAGATADPKTGVIDVTPTRLQSSPSLKPEPEIIEIEKTAAEEKDPLKDWVDNFGKE